MRRLCCHPPCAGPIVSPIDPKAAVDNRDSLAKTLYSRLFDWLVDKINTSIGQDPNAATMVGVLDIYGPSANQMELETGSRAPVLVHIFAFAYTF